MELELVELVCGIYKLLSVSYYKLDHTSFIFYSIDAPS
jgi:hypothetical protein